MVIQTENNKVTVLDREKEKDFVLVNESGDSIIVHMADNGFELRYNGKNYYAKDGWLEPFRVSPRGNEYISSMQHHESGACACNDVPRGTGTPHAKHTQG